MAFGYGGYGGYGSSFSSFNYGLGSSFGLGSYYQSSTSGEGSGDGFWGNVGDSLSGFFTEGESGEAVDESAAAATRGLTAAFLDAIGVGPSSGGSSGSSDSSGSSGSSSGGMMNNVPGWGLLLGLIAVILLGVEVFTSG